MTTGDTEDYYLADYIREINNYVITTAYFDDWPVCGKLFHNGLTDLSKRVWQITLPLLACQAVGGSSDVAVPVAAAWVAMLISSHVLDSVQDGEFVPLEGIGSPEDAINLSVKMLFAITHFLSSIEQPVAFRRVIKLFSTAGSQSTTGQHKGLTQEYEAMRLDDALEAYWQAIILKSGSLFSVAAASGAALGADSEVIVEALADYGTCLGVLLQILDDCRDIMGGTGPNKYEISLPILLYSLACGNDRIVIPEAQSPADLNRLFNQTGVPGALSTIILDWRKRALDSIKSLEPSQARSALERIVNTIIE